MKIDITIDKWVEFPGLSATVKGNKLLKHMKLKPFEKFYTQKIVTENIYVNAGYYDYEELKVINLINNSMDQKTFKAYVLYKRSKDLSKYDMASITDFYRDLVGIFNDYREFYAYIYDMPKTFLDSDSPIPMPDFDNLYYTLNVIEEIPISNSNYDPRRQVHTSSDNSGTEVYTNKLRVFFKRS